MPDIIHLWPDGAPGSEGRYRAGERSLFQEKMRSHLSLELADGQQAVAPGARTRPGVGPSGRPAEMHIYAQGGHGFGMFKPGLPSDAWIERFGEWLATQGLLLAPA